MTQEDELGKRAHAMLKRVMGLDPPVRRAFVISACSDDQPLTDRVLELLDAADRCDSFLDVPALANPDAPLPQQAVPDAVGSYLVVGVLGAGGMATVYEAIQEQPRRRVALKVLHQSMTQTDAYVRFLFETETLARLHHPGIAQIYEAGAAPLGPSGPAPFFAMELIPDAVPITTYANNESLSIRQRITMVASVCDAVQHGHQHGVIHRDLKPGNVLVDHEGRPKVIDFGVARTTEPNADSPTNRTDVKQLVGTLNYMSPEQCGAATEIDIRTDVYSLGVMLYELVFGHLPHDLSSLPLPAALHTIVHEKPRRPSLPHVHGHRDLEAIVFKAIEKEPDRRYDSVSALAADLRRWLNHQAIEARPPSVLEQCRLFARRNRALVGAGLTILVSIMLLATISTIFVVRFAEEVRLRRIAELQGILERDQARWQAYTAQIAGALSAMKTSDFHQMRSRLAAAAHPNRGWEWRFLMRLAEPSASVIAAHRDMVMDMAISHDGTRLATAASDGSIRLWNAQDRTLLAEYTSDSGIRSMTVSFATDDRAVISGDEAGMVRLFDAATLVEVDCVAELPSPVRRAIGLPDGRVAVATADGAVMAWTPGSRQEAAIASDQPGGVRGLELSPDRALLATYNDLGHLWIRLTADLAAVHRLTFPGGVHQVRFSADGRMVAAAGESGRLLIWSVIDGTVLHDIQATRGLRTLRSVAFSNDSTMVAAGLVHRGIVLFSLRDGQTLGELGGHTEAVSGLRFLPGDEVLVSSSWDRTIRVWNIDQIASQTGQTLAAHRRHVLRAAFSPDGSTIASVSLDGTVLLWDPDLAQPLAKLTSDTNQSMHAVDFSPDGRLIAAGGADGSVQLWDALTGAALPALRGHRRWVASLAFDPAGRRIASGSDDADVLVWNLEAPEEPLKLSGHRERINSVQFSPDGRIIATGSRDRSVRLWDAQTGEELRSFTLHDSDVFAVLFSPDGTRLYTGSRDQSVIVWDVHSGAMIERLAGHGHFVTSLALSPDGTRLAAASWYGDVFLFDVQTLDSIASFRAHEAAVRSVQFSPDGRWLVTGSYDATVRLFDATTREESDAARAQAQMALTAAEQRVMPILSGADVTAADVRDLLHQADLDLEHDPWVRKAVISLLAPPEGL